MSNRRALHQRKNTTLLGGSVGSRASASSIGRGAVRWRVRCGRLGWEEEKRTML
jgi:hypothetical protein